MAHLQDPEQGYIVGFDDDFNWTWVKIVRLRNYLAEGCTEPIVYGANILRDPGFESHLSLTPTGPDSEVFGGEIGVGAPGWALSWADGAFVPLSTVDSTGWGVQTNNGVGFYNGYRWGISSANSRSGAFHARFNHLTLTSQNAPGLSPIGLRMCPPKTGIAGAPGLNGVWSAKVNPGDDVRFRVYVAASNLTDNWWVTVEFKVWDEPVENVISTNFTDGQILSTSYTAFEHSETITAGGVYVLASVYLTIAGVSSADVSLDIDDAELEVVAA